jgi:hypothetical protein
LDWTHNAVAAALTATAPVSRPGRDAAKLLI